MNNSRPTPYSSRHTILLGLTTTPGSNWREKVKEIDEFGIKEVALFPTYLEVNERQELYGLLEESGLRRIVFTHLRAEDMSTDEVLYLQNRFGCELFNIHSHKNEIAPPTGLDQFRDKIYVENAGKLDRLEEVAERYAGLCIDFAHWEAGLLQSDSNYDNFSHLIKKYKTGFAHISAVLKKPIYVDWDIEHKLHYDLHTLNNFSELDYLKKYTTYLPEILGLELENSFKEQLKAKEYIEKMIVER